MQKSTATTKVNQSFTLQMNKPNHSYIRSQTLKPAHYKSHFGSNISTSKMNKKHQITTDQTHFCRINEEIEQRTHHERVNEQVIVLKRIESGASIRPILVRFAQLQTGHHRGQTTEHHVVEQLHCYSEKVSELEMRKKESS